MVSKSKQNWEVGSTVKVGFLQLKVIACVPTPNDGAPDAYFLTNLAGDKLYEFVPHQGLRSASLEDANERISAYRAHAERVATQAVSRAQKAAAITGRFNDLFAEVA